MSDFSVRSDNVDVEQIMRQIRSRIREKRGVDYTEDEIRELANVKLEKFLDPERRAVGPARAVPQGPRRADACANYAFEDTRSTSRSRGRSCVAPQALQPILKLFFNPNPLIEALHISSRQLNDSCAAAPRRSTTR